MNVRNVLKVYGLLRQLTDDESALLETLRAFTDSEREQFVEALAPVKATTATGKQPERCTHVYDSGLVCGGAKRNIVHHNTNHVDYHEFTTKKVVKSARASSLAEKIKGTAKGEAREPRCVACYETADHPNHDVENGGHEFTTDLAKRVNAALDGATPPDPDTEQRCTATRDGGRICDLLVDHNVHQMKSAMGHHEFVGGGQAVAVGGD